MSQVLKETSLKGTQKCKFCFISASLDRIFAADILMPNSDLAGLGSATVAPKIVRKKPQKMENSDASDFIFAVRLARATKGILQTDWSVNPFTKKATFNAGEGKIDVHSVVLAEGMENVQVVEDEETEQVFVID